MNSKEAIAVFGGWIEAPAPGKWRTLDYKGAADSLRVQAAGKLYRTNSSLIIASGGAGKLAPGSPTVAQVIKGELVELGVLAGNVILETCSYDTLDQLLETNRIAQQRDLSSVKIISNAWHLPRIKAMMDTHPLLRRSITKFELVPAEDIVDYASKDETPILMQIIADEQRGIEQIQKDTYNYGFNICGRKVGPSEPVFVVAEISGNHHQNYDEAVKLVKAAAEAGADAVKFQTYTPETITMDSDKEWFKVGGEDNPDSWKGKTLYQLYRENYTPWDWLPKLQGIARELGLIFFSSPFDETAVDFLESLDVPAYKVASYEATHIPLLKKVGETGKPVILSIGFADLEEIEEALQTLKQSGSSKVAILDCTVNYTDKPDKTMTNLGNITDLSKRFGVVTGFSDNNAGIEIPIEAVKAGAFIIEKHLILDRNLGGADARFSLEPQEFKEMVKKIRLLTPTLSSQRRGRKGEEGRIHYGPTSPAEEYNKRFRRSIFAVDDIKRGEKFTTENVKVIRPAFGLEPKYYEEVLGKSAAIDLERGTPLKREHIV